MEDAAAPECGGYCPRCDADMQIKTGMQVDIYRVMLAAAPTPPQLIYDEAAELNRLFGAAREMLRIAGLANQGSNAYNRAIVNLHEAVTACAQSRAKAVEVA